LSGEISDKNGQQPIGWLGLTPASLLGNLLFDRVICCQAWTRGNVIL